MMEMTAGGRVYSDWADWRVEELMGKWKEGRKAREKKSMRVKK